MPSIVAFGQQLDLFRRSRRVQSFAIYHGLRASLVTIGLQSPAKFPAWRRMG